MTVKSFPAITPDYEEWRLISNSQTFDSDLTGATQAKAMPGAVWRCTMQFTNRSGRDARALKAFVSGLRGRAGRFRVSPEDWQDLGTRGRELEPFNVVDGGVEERFAVIVEGQTALFNVTSYSGTYDAQLSAPAQSGDKTISVSGLPASQGEVFLAGDFIQVGDELKKVLADIDADANGEASIRVAPPIRESYPAGEPLITFRPAAVMMLQDDVQARRSLTAPEFYNITLECREPLDI